MCTVFGIRALKPSDPRELLRYSAQALVDLQHRGHEWIGMAHSNGGTLHFTKQRGWVSSVFDDEEKMDEILADAPQMLCAHTRYSTTGSSTSLNAQPHYVRTRRGAVALASNGDIFDYSSERSRLEEMGCRIRSKNDGELLLCDILQYAEDDLSRITEGISLMMQNLRGSYSSWMVTEDDLYVFRDPAGNRPLYYMKVGSYFIFSSEDCALQGILIQRAEDGEDDGTVDILQVLPGQIIKINRHGEIHCVQGAAPHELLSLCAFEWVYFARPDSAIHMFDDMSRALCYRVCIRRDEFGYILEIPEESVEEVASFRYRLGKKTAEECPVDADCIIAVPDSGNLAGIGYATALGLPFRIGFVRNPYITRTFTTPGQSTRTTHVARKFRSLRALFRAYKRIGKVDDSVVFGASAARLVRMLKAAGAEEVHGRISCPPVIAECRYGIDMTSKGKLIAQGKTVEQVRQELGMTSLGYLSLEGLREVIGGNARHSCLACWTGQYPI